MIPTSPSKTAVTTAAARALQNGFLRAYAALLVLGLVGVALYFLLQSS